MAKLPTIKTGRLVLRPRSMVDLEACLAMDRDADVTRYIPGPWTKPEEHRAFVMSRMSAHYPDGFGYWTVVDCRAPDDFLGWILLLPYETATSEAEIGWRFNRNSWGRGYASEAAAAILDHALQALGVDRVIADIDPDNIASIRVAEKSGMQFARDRILDGCLTESYQISR